MEGENSSEELLEHSAAALSEEVPQCAAVPPVGRFSFRSHWQEEGISS